MKALQQAREINTVFDRFLGRPRRKKHLFTHNLIFYGFTAFTATMSKLLVFPILALLTPSLATAVEPEASGTLATMEDNELLRRGHLFQQADRDNNDSISWEEYRTLSLEQAERRFKQLDKNGDKVIDRDEVRAAADAAGVRRRPPRDRPNHTPISPAQD